MLLTVEELSERMDWFSPLGDSEFVAPTWRYEWGPFLLILQEQSREYIGTVVLVLSSLRFQTTVPIGDNPQEALTKVLDRMVRYIRALEPHALQEAADFLLDAAMDPVGRPALERIAEGP